MGNEDCLYLNVYTPEVQVSSLEYEIEIRVQEKFSMPPEKIPYITLLIVCLIFYLKQGVYQAKYPVMVYIQAESFENGDSSLYGPEKLLDKEVVIVTFNYRLGILGFLSTGDDVAPGNWGLHDQRLLLEWVKGNIDHFSGDPNKITLFGQGAGAASVIFHLSSPASQGLFHGAIAQSGSALCDWAIERNPLRFAQDVAETLGCPPNPSTKLVECLRTMSSSALLRAQSKFKVRSFR